MEKTKYYSYKNNQLTKGCQLCVEGKKLVLFITGLCNKSCWYCPLSEEKYKKDVQFANERTINTDQDLIEDAKTMQACGVGITGGDPLKRLDLTLHYITLLKTKFGQNFHIHLYTSPESITKEILERLELLDEIRLHPDLEDKKYWKNLELLSYFKNLKGIEIPLIPSLEKETFELIEYVKNKINFINLNELEIAHTEHNKVLDLGFQVKEEFSYAVKESEELGKKILEKYSNLNIHLCTAKLKDKVQLGNRIKRQARFSSHRFDIITRDGSLIRGAIYLEKPSFNYRDELKKKNKEEEIKRLKKFREIITKKLQCAKKDLFIDKIKYRFLVSSKFIRKHQNEIKELYLINYLII